MLSGKKAPKVASRRRNHHHEAGDDDDGDKDDADGVNDDDGDAVEFVRPPGAVGVVLHAGDDDDDEGDDGDEGFDELRLRRYELSKLRYYLAVAECDCDETAASLYEQLDGLVHMSSSSPCVLFSIVMMMTTSDDGWDDDDDVDDCRVEMEHSSMVFTMKLVPDDIR